MKAISTKLLPATAKRGTRIVAKDEDGNKIFYIPPDTFKPEGDHHEAAAKCLCEKMNWTGELVKGSTGPGQWVFCFYPKDGPLLKSCKALLYLVARDVEKTVERDGEESLQSDVRDARRAILNAGGKISATEPWDV